MLNSGNEVARFVYDGFDRRVQKLVGSTTTTFIYDGIDVSEERQSGSMTVRYYRGTAMDELWASQDGSGTASYYVADHLGSIVRVTGGSGGVTLTRQYDLWGNLESGSTTAGPAYTGREWDPETGLYYYRARYYDSQLGRFISEDPVGFQAGPNFYSYVLNGPSLYLDPSGLDVAVIYGAPQGINFFGHVAIAVTGQGVFSSGTKEPFGSSAMDFLQSQATYRDTFVYILPGTPQQDQAVVQAFLAAAKRGHSFWRNNCSDVVGEALKAGGLIGKNAVTKLPGFINSYMLRRLEDGGLSAATSIPKGASEGRSCDK